MQFCRLYHSFQVQQAAPKTITYNLDLVRFFFDTIVLVPKNITINIYIALRNKQKINNYNTMSSCTKVSPPHYESVFWVKAGLIFCVPEIFSRGSKIIELSSEPNILLLHPFYLLRVL